jgi:hypothetical protein
MTKVTLLETGATSQPWPNCGLSHNRVQKDMLCEKCQERVATIHLHGSSTTISSHGEAMGHTDRTEHHLCDQCGSRSVQAILHPPLEAGSRREAVRVLSVSPTHTVLRLVRTASEPVPEDWTLLTSRLGTELPVGEELELTFTESELEWLQGKRETYPGP